MVRVLRRRARRRRDLADARDGSPTPTPIAAANGLAVSGSGAAARRPRGRARSAGGRASSASAAARACACRSSSPGSSSSAAPGRRGLGVADQVDAAHGRSGLGGAAAEAFAMPVFGARFNPPDARVRPFRSNLTPRPPHPNPCARLVRRLIGLADLPDIAQLHRFPRSDLARATRSTPIGCPPAPH